MYEGARKLPTQHISIRVPWHDSDWDGTVCKNPEKNIACRVLPRIADEKDDVQEIEVKGRKFSDLPESKLPPCITEQGRFMAPFPITKGRKHPSANPNSKLYGHFLETPFTFEPYSAACVPFRWMNLKESKKIIEQYDLGFDGEIEPEIDFYSAWIQDRRNHLVMLDSFFSAIEPNKSLCFFYAKDTPLSSSQRRTIVGVGVVNSISEGKEYNYKIENPEFRSMIWERNVKHSIRPDFQNGFLFPYNEILKLAEEQGFDPEEYVAFAPDEAFGKFFMGIRACYK